MSALYSSDPASRRYDLDWLRVIAFALLIFYHIGMFYVTWGWHVKSDHSSSFLEPAMALLNPWRLALLFFISGVALRFAADSRGFRSLLPARSVRLFVPLVFGMLVWIVPQAYLELRFKGEFDGGMLAFYPRYLGFGDGFSIITPTWNHLWYVAYMLVYTLLLGTLSPLLRMIERRFGATLGSMLERMPAMIFLLSVPFMVYALVLDPRFPTTHAMIDDWATHAHSFSLVVAGWYAARSEAFWRAIDRIWPMAGGIALALAVALLAARMNWQAVRAVDGGREAMMLVRVLYAWCVIVTLLGLARRFLTRSSPTLSYMNEAVFSWYILHQTIIVVVGYAMIGSRMPAWLEGLVLVLATVIACLAVHEFVIRRTRWLRPLFGLPASRRGAGRADPSRTPFAIAKKPV